MSGATGTSWCAEQVRRHDHDRYLTALFAPGEHRETLFALYAFNLEIARTREAVSEPMLGRIRLQWWRDVIGELHAGPPREHPVLQALAPRIVSGALPRDGFMAMIDAREADLDDTPPADLAALEAYAAATSGELSALAMRAVGTDAAVALASARSVGTAWALIGLMRAVAFHAQARRLFLPGDLLRDFNIDADALLELQPTANLDRVVRAVVERATALLTAARAARTVVPRATRSPLLLATLADGHIATLRRRNFDVFALAPASPPQPLRLLWTHLRGRY